MNQKNIINFKINKFCAKYLCWRIKSFLLEEDLIETSDLFIKVCKISFLLMDSLIYKQVQSLKELKIITWNLFISHNINNRLICTNCHGNIDDDWVKDEGWEIEIDRDSALQHWYFARYSIVQQFIETWPKHIQDM